MKDLINTEHRTLKNMIKCANNRDVQLYTAKILKNCPRKPKCQSYKSN